MEYTTEEKLYLFYDLLGLPFARREKLFANFSSEELGGLTRSRNQKLEPWLGDRFCGLSDSLEKFPAFLDSLEKEEIYAVTRVSVRYPALLAEIDSPPFVLYCKGNLDLLGTRCLGIVGRRACGRDAKLATEKFARTLASAGLTVVSGMAEGCDAAAHLAALEVGRTIAVLAGGFHHIYPQSNYPLYERICREGLAVTESVPDRRPQRGDFLERNRIVAGLSEGVLLTSAGERSGTTATANDCVSAGRELFVIPGSIFSEDYKGSNRLLRELQGSLVTCPEEILETLGILLEKETEEILPGGVKANLSGSEKEILAVLKHGEVHINEIATGLSRSFSEISPLLTIMEIKGLVEKLPGNCYRSKPVL